MRKPSPRESYDAIQAQNRRQTRQEQALSARADGWSHDTAVGIGRGRPGAQEMVEAYEEDLDPGHHGVPQKLVRWGLSAWMRGDEGVFVAARAREEREALRRLEAHVDVQRVRCAWPKCWRGVGVEGGPNVRYCPVHQGAAKRRAGRRRYRRWYQENLTLLPRGTEAQNSGG